MWEGEGGVRAGSAQRGLGHKRLIGMHGWSCVPLIQGCLGTECEWPKTALSVNELCGLCSLTLDGPRVAWACGRGGGGGSCKYSFCSLRKG